MKSWTKQKIISCIKEVLPTTTKTCIWILKITVGISFAMMLLKYFNILPYVSDAIGPVFRYFGLPGSAALAYLSGYFINVYSAMAVMSTLALDARELTILSTMVLCSHSMILETAVLKKTGVSGVRMIIVRTLSALFLGWFLNLILPEGSGEVVTAAVAREQLTFWLTLRDWLWSTFKLVLLITIIIYILNIVQRLLYEFGVIAMISKFLKPLMLFFGLPPKTAFLWIVANIIGLAYGAAAMLDEIARDKLERRDVLLINTHISISHSNLEDLILLTALGAVGWIMLLIRWAMSMVLVWELRLEFYIKDAIAKRKNRNFVV
ncbi:MAG TPA: nucleoside recognition domain-containing protein [Bacteroidales bacterium]|nr:nucleoside recognition domain-containing protein [Bacteroidales bacterium]